jgi:hypothetical protein
MAKTTIAKVASNSPKKRPRSQAEFNKVPVFSFRLIEDLRPRLEKMAIDEERSLGYLVNKAVGEYLTKKGY